MPGVILLYLGVCCVFTGLVLMLSRWRWRLHLFLAGVALIAVGLLLPAPREMRIAEPQTRLDRLAPAWQFNEFHSSPVNAPCSQAWKAIKEVTAGEIKLFGTLTWIRRFGRPGPESILNAPASTPILEVATRTGFQLLAEDPGREIVIGMTLIPPDRAKGFMNFQLTELGTGGCEVTTETRVHATDVSARRRFAAYWRVIYPGSALDPANVVAGDSRAGVISSVARDLASSLACWPILVWDARLRCEIPR